MSDIDTKVPAKRNVARVKEERPEGMLVSEIVRKYGLPRCRVINAILQGWITPIPYKKTRLILQADIEAALKPSQSYCQVKSKGTPGEPIGLEVSERKALKLRKTVEPFATQAGASEYQSMLERHFSKQENPPFHLMHHPEPWRQPGDDDYAANQRRLRAMQPKVTTAEAHAQARRVLQAACRQAEQGATALVPLRSPGMHDAHRPRQVPLSVRTGIPAKTATPDAHHI